MCELLFILQHISVTVLFYLIMFMISVLSVCCCALLNFESFIHVWEVVIWCMGVYPTLLAHPEGNLKKRKNNNGQSFSVSQRIELTGNVTKSVGI